MWLEWEFKGLSRGLGQRAQSDRPPPLVKPLKLNDPTSARLFVQRCHCSLTFLVDILAMPDTDHQHKQTLVVNFVDDPVIANSNPPSIIFARQLDAPGWARIVCQCVDGRFNSRVVFAVNAAQFASCR